MQFWSKVKISVISVLLFFAIKQNAPVKSIDPELQVYYNSFIEQTLPICEEKYAIVPPRAIIMFKKQPKEEGVVGLCSRNFMGYQIEIDPDYFYSASDINRKVLLYHELTHCILAESHHSNYNHYMYAYLNNNITETVLNEQLSEILKTKCSKP